jgi:hypothetical protein
VALKNRENSSPNLDFFFVDVLGLLFGLGDDALGGLRVAGLVLLIVAVVFGVLVARNFDVAWKTML